MAMTPAEFVSLAARIAQKAAHWAADTATMKGTIRPADAERFATEIRQMADFIEDEAKRMTLADAGLTHEVDPTRPMKDRGWKNLPGANVGKRGDWKQT